MAEIQPTIAMVFQNYAQTGHRRMRAPSDGPYRQPMTHTAPRRFA